MADIPSTNPQDKAQRLQTARDVRQPPEILQKLADDPDAEVRIAVAGNAAAPPKAQVLLAIDKNPNVRAALAARAAELVPRLAQTGVPHAAALAMHTLEALAMDQIVHVRVALSSALKDVALAPPAIARKLAQDTARDVAEPILRYCLALQDEDLIELIASRHDDWSKSAIAARPALSEKVGDVIISSGDSAAVTTLLNNHGAAISDARLAHLIERAATEKQWQEGLATRRRLPPQLALSLAEFAEGAIMLLLRARRDFDPETAKDIVATARRRIDWIIGPGSGDSGKGKAERMFLLGEIGEKEIGDALSWNEQEFVRYALAFLARVPADTVITILKSASAKSVTALAWRAGLSMRCALQIQARAAEIPSDKLLNARSGTDYPLTEVQMIWQLELFGIKS